MGRGMPEKGEVDTTIVWNASYLAQLYGRVEGSVGHSLSADLAAGEGPHQDALVAADNLYRIFICGHNQGKGQCVNEHTRVMKCGRAGCRRCLVIAPSRHVLRFGC